MRIKIDALDTLVFGKGKPSVWGEDAFGVGTFPPYPSVVRGAVRTNALIERDMLEAVATDDDPTKDFAVTAFALLIGGKPHFVAPADFVWENGRLTPCKLVKNDGLSNLETPCQLVANSKDKVESASSRFISLDDLRTYLEDGDVAALPSAGLGDYITAESRIGIFINRGTGTVKESMLYRTPLTRLENADGKKLSIVAEIDCADSSSGLVRFGGENKVASFAPFDGGIAPGALQNYGETIKIYLTTPAIFNDGWLPTLPGAELLAAAVYGYESVGGFDMRLNAPKPMRRAVKAGSVYYYRVTDESRREEIAALHGTSISDYSREDGFGICYIGKMKEDYNV